MSNMPVRDAANSDQARDRPLDPAVVQQAAALAARYLIAVHSGQNGYVGTVEGFPSVLGHGTSEAAAITSTRELLKWAIAYLIDAGRTPRT
jgi:predicted RNase H-like HicB family nuclease